MIKNIKIYLETFNETRQRSWKDSKDLFASEHSLLHRYSGIII